MRLAPRPLLAAAALCAGLAVVRAEDAAKIDPARQAEQFAPGPDNARPTEKIEQQRAERVQDARAALAGLRDEPTAPLADRRAPIDVTETREKNLVERKDAPLATTPIERKDSPLSGQTARDQFQPDGSLYRNAGAVAEKFQQGIRDAELARARLQPDLGRQTTFDRLNRFVFKRNGPGTPEGGALVTAAGGGAATALPTAEAAEPAARPSLGSGGGGIELIGVGIPANRPAPSGKIVPISGSGAAGQGGAGAFQPPR
jgi:hypothetical protein